MSATLFLTAWCGPFCIFFPGVSLRNPLPEGHEELSYAICVSLNWPEAITKRVRHMPASSFPVSDRLTHFLDIESLAVKE